MEWGETRLWIATKNTYVDLSPKEVSELDVNRAHS